MWELAFFNMIYREIDLWMVQIGFVIHWWQVLSKRMETIFMTSEEMQRTIYHDGNIVSENLHIFKI